MIKNTIIINLFGGSCVGKSTLASDIFAKLKRKDIEVEIAVEHARELIWENQFPTLENQVYILGIQCHRIERMLGKVDFIIAEAPLLHCIIYTLLPNKEKILLNPNYNQLSQKFNDFNLELFNRYNNINYLIERCKPFSCVGRSQKDEEESKLLDIKIKDMLEKNKIPYKTVKGNEFGANEIFHDISILENIRKE